MREQPDGRALLAIARTVLREQLLPWEAAAVLMNGRSK